MKTRGSGILAHVTSLSSPYGIGDLGPGAYRFIDFLSQTGQTYWQVLPLNPTDTAYGSSPYSSISAFAGNPLVISPELLLSDGFLAEGTLPPLPEFPAESVNYAAVTEHKEKLFTMVYKRFLETQLYSTEFEVFCKEHTYWLDDYALFAALKIKNNGAQWMSWPKPIRDREREALKKERKLLNDKIKKIKLLQFIFFTQWGRLKNYASSKGIHIIGDLPIYVSTDSADVWAHPSFFKLTKTKRPSAVAGVPPDYFSSTGQLWGNPVYDWDALKKDSFSLWINRLRHNLSLYDLVRIDHFRGLVAYWEVPSKEKTAINGKWVPVPVKEFFDVLKSNFPNLPFIAEDLGIITDDVKEVMAAYGLPGMKVLHFAFYEDKPDHPYLPHNYTQNCIVYTGTHDNNTTKGWFDKDTQPEDKERYFKYIGKTLTNGDINWSLIQLAMMSVANTVIIPVQDILGLDAGARMNMPGKAQGNWSWRIKEELLDNGTRAHLKEVTMRFNRIPVTV